MVSTPMPIVRPFVRTSVMVAVPRITPIGGPRCQRLRRRLGRRIARRGAAAREERKGRENCARNFRFHEL
jgi:hypothetical protein